MISQLPVLPETQYRNLIQNKTLVQTVRLLARVLSVALPQELLGKLKLPENYREISQRDISRNKRGLAEFLPKETSSIMLKLALLTLVKTSNALYVPKKAESVGG